MKAEKPTTLALRAILREAAASARLIDGLADAPVAFYPAEREEMRRYRDGLSALAAETRRAPAVSRAGRRA